MKTASFSSIFDEDRWRPLFKEYLSKKGLRMTNQRLAIVRAALGHKDHFTAEELLGQTREIDRSVSRATVYRCLPILTESGLIKEIDVGRDYKVYIAQEGRAKEQAQIICLDCEKIFEIDAPFLEWYGATVSEKLDLEPESQRLQVHAHCTRKKLGQCDRQ